MLKQLSFLYAKLYPPFGLADALTLSSGIALCNSETKVSLKKHRFATATACFVKLPRQKEQIAFNSLC